jgi:polysaccharide biosynthesis/export protein
MGVWMSNNFTSGGLLVALVAIGLGGCSSLPTAGPTTKQVVGRAADEKTLYDLIEVDGRVVKALATRPAQSLRNRFRDYGQPPSPQIGIGDSLTVAIWEAAGGGLFGTTETAPGAVQAGTPGGGRSVTLPEQVVAQDGSISVPYAGRIRAAGRTPYQVQREIQDALSTKAIEPQAVVTITKSTSNTVTVLGDIVAGIQIPLSIRGERLLEVVAAAGGAKAPVYETTIRLTRDGVTVTVPMDRLVADPRENIYAWPGDVITLVRAPQTFLVFGAIPGGGVAGTNSEIAFGGDRLDLARAMAKAGGLEDTRADPSGVFLFRFETTSMVRTLGAPILTSESSSISPVIYHLDLRDPEGYFLAKRFPMEEGDIIYVANAEATDWQKFLNLVALASAPVITGVLLARPAATP